MVNLLYLCSYNMDRSIACTIITPKKVGELGYSGLFVDSAALKPPVYLGIRDEMIQALRNAGYIRGSYVPNHIPKLADGHLLYQQDIVLVMAKSQIEAVENILEKTKPEGKQKPQLYTLSGYAEVQDGEIPNPERIIRPKKRPIFFSRKHYEKRNKQYISNGWIPSWDKEAVDIFYNKMVLTLEKYIVIALERMEREGLIIKAA